MKEKVNQIRAIEKKKKNPLKDENPMIVVGTSKGSIFLYDFQNS